MPEAPSDEAVAQFLIKSGMATQDQIQTALRQQARNAISGKPLTLGEILQAQGVITAEQRKAVEKKAGSRKGVSRLGPYKLKRKIGEGGMGIVYLARDTRDRKLVALKLLSKAQAREEGAVQRFRREVEAAMRLDHVNIARAFHFGHDEGYRYYVMEYCEGEPLGKRLKREKRLPIEESIDVVIQVARALRYAHENGVVHRDIKPENVIVTLDGVAKVLDLGLSKKLGDDEATYQTVSGVAMGTPHYISPEQARGEREIDGRADLYSLGATFYHLVTGDTPFHGSSSFEVVTKHLTAQLPDPRDLREEIPDDVVLVIRRMMAKRRQDRYGDAGELLKDLERLVVGEAPTTQELDPNLSSIAEPVKVPKVTPRPRRPLAMVRKPRPRRPVSPLLWISVGAAAVLLGVLIAIAASSRPVKTSALSEPAETPAPRPRPAPPILPPKPPSPRTAQAPEDAREAEAKWRLSDLREAERQGTLAAVELRHRYDRFANEFKDTPTGRATREWLRKQPPPVERDAPAPKPAPAAPAAAAEPRPQPAAAPVPAPEAAPEVLLRPRSPDPAGPARLPIPGADELKGAEARLQKRYGADVLRTPAAERESVSRKLVRMGLETEDAAEQYALFRDAGELATLAASPAAAFEAIDALAARFDAPAPSLKLAALSRIRPAARSAEAHTLADASLALAAEAARDGDFATAAAAAGRAEQLLPGAENAEAAGRARALRRDAEALKADSLKAKEDDESAGRYLCFGRGEWHRGLPLLARSGDAALKALAERDLAGARDAASQAGVGDAWWDLAESEKNEFRKARIVERARRWYETALPGTADADRARLEARLEREKPRPGPAGTPVDDAIRKGASFLLARAGSMPSSEHSGVTMRHREIVLLALLHAKTRWDEPVFRSLFQAMMDGPLESTYEVSLQATLLAEMDPAKYQGRIQQCAQFLADNQTPDGSWAYGAPSVFAMDLPRGDTRLEAAGPDPLRSRKAPKRVSVRKQRDGTGGADFSNAAYAALGIRACADAGVSFETALLQRAQNAWRSAQKLDKPTRESTGGWCYKAHPDHGAYGSMTASGLSSLAIYGWLLDPSKTGSWKRDRAIDAAQGWLGRNFSVTWNPGPYEHGNNAVNSPQQLHYYLYALERAGQLCGVEGFGGRPWYTEGAQFLRGSQRTDGSWGNLPDTCLAILFLARSTRPLDSK
jgi:serine/threonine-protein kinase